ncbi:MAG: hypothetical protein QM731_09905 [Chitinophagaceae bacterium]
MKLTKMKLLAIVRDGIRKQGYVEVKDSLTGSQGLFIKQLEGGLYLSLGLTLSNLFNSVFTGTYYLSKTTRWGAIWGDIPRESYRRIGNFLFPDERRKLLEKEYWGEEIVDAWWNVEWEPAIDCFIEAIRITEKRFLDQDGLITAISGSKEINVMKKYAQSVTEIIKSKKENDRVYDFIPDRGIDDIPVDWFNAAEMTLIEENGVLNKNTVKLLAADAWRQFTVSTTRNLS